MYGMDINPSLISKITDILLPKIEEVKIRLDEFEERWSDKYPHTAKSWRANWEELMTYFDYPVEIRKLLI